MTSHGLAILSFVLIACGSTSQRPAPQAKDGSAVASQPTPPAPPTIKELGIQSLEWLRTGKARELRGIFSTAMTEAMPSDASVAQIWPGIEGQLGAFKRVIELTESEKNGHHVVVATCEFERTAMDVWLVFDKDRHLAGLNVKESKHPSALPPRPQHPKPPFDYDSREVSYDNATDKTHLAGTLTLPKGAGPFAAVLLVTGSGTQDRDETIFGHKPFLVIADHLTRHGIAVLRVDDPGAGGSTGDLEGATIESHARDAEAGIAFLKAQKEIDPRRIGLIGHSEGGLIAGIVASRSKDVTFVVSLSGTGVPGSTINVMQVESGLRSRKDLPEVAINEILAAQKKIVSLVMEGAEDRVLQAALDDAQVVAKKYTPESSSSAGAGVLKLLTSPWFKSFLKLDPRGYWRKVKVPVLAMNGDLDTQVTADVNLPEIQAALRKAKNKDVQIEKLAGLNHLFQPATTGLVDEYGTISTTFDPSALDLMTSWLNKRTRAK